MLPLERQNRKTLCCEHELHIRLLRTVSTSLTKEMPAPKVELSPDLAQKFKLLSQPRPREPKKDATASTTTTVRDVPATRIEPSRHVSALSSMRLEWVYLLATSSLLVTRSTTELSRRILVLIDDD